MAESIREQAKAKVKDKLAAIANPRAWGSYDTLPTVTRDYRDLQQVNQFPHVMVVDAAGATEEYSASGSANKAYVLHRLPLRVIAYVKGDDQVSRSTWIERIREDIITTLRKNSTLDGLIQDIDLGDEESVDEGEYDQLGSAFGHWSKLIRLVIQEEVDVA